MKEQRSHDNDTTGLTLHIQLSSPEISTNLYLIPLYFGFQKQYLRGEEEKERKNMSIFDV